MGIGAIEDVALSTADAHAGMVFVPGGTFRMGSDKHYPEEAPVHRVTVDGFWIDRAPVTNREFRKFVNATGYVAFAEISPNLRTIPVRCRTCSRLPRSSSRRLRIRSTRATEANGGISSPAPTG